jgi:hypothetical protein
MIKAGGVTKDGRPLLLLGLSEENVRRLQLGQPIDLDTAELRTEAHQDYPSMLVVIFAGKTEESMAAEIKEHIEVTEQL